MHSFRIPALFAITGAALLVWSVAPVSTAQNDIAIMDTDQASAQLTRAQTEAAEAEARAERLIAEAENATRSADRVAREAAALAAQIQQIEAQYAIAQAEYSLAQIERERLAGQLAQRQQPLVRLTAALQTMSQRPMVLSALQPGSLRETVYVRAVLDGATPIIRERTSALRGELERGLALEREAAAALTGINQSEAELRERRTALQQLEAQRRLASRDAEEGAARERDRALALAEDARDLDGLVGQLAVAAKLREELAALPGPVLRPARPAVAEVLVDSSSAAAAVPDARSIAIQLPIQGRIAAGFGAERSSGLRATGVTIVPASAAQVVAPAEGRVAFAGPYRGFGRIIIIEHSGGWASLITGLERTTIDVGEELLAGSPIGNAATDMPAITVELRRDGTPVNPLEYIG